MSLNDSKCKVMHLGKINLGEIYTLNNHILEETKWERDLGIVFTNDLKWSSQVSTVVAKANRMLGMLKRNFKY